MTRLTCAVTSSEQRLRLSACLRLTIRFGVLAALAALLLACNRSDDQSNLPRYFDALATHVATLDSVHSNERSAARPTADAAADEARFRAFAAALDALRPPSPAEDAHHDLVVASRNLADDAGRDAAGAGASIATASATTAAVSSRATSDVREWERACHVLQDLATARRIDVDLRCATALDGR